MAEKKKSLVRTIAIFVAVSAASWFGIQWFRGLGKKPTEDIRKEFVQSSGHSVIQIQASTPDALASLASPENDSWNTEVISAGAKKQLTKFGKFLADNDDESILHSVAEEGFHGKIADIDSLSVVYRDDALQVRRISTDSRDTGETSGILAFAQNLADSHRLKISRAKFKIASVEPSDRGATTKVLVELLRTSEREGIQENVVWKCFWNDQLKPPRLRAIELLDYECIHRMGGNLFEDTTAAVIGHTRDYAEHVLRGVDHWSQRLTALDDMHMYGHHGIAVGDVNGDGLDDVYVCDSGGLPNRLYLQNEDGTATDFSKESKSNWLESSAAALLIDVDNDGDQDLVVATVACILLAENDGQGIFTPKDAVTGIREAHTLCAADYDNDGDLDLYVCNYGPAGTPGGERGFEASIPIPYNDANNGGPNALLQNVGNFKFQNVTQQVGLDQNNRRFSFAASWADYDLDGDADLYVANDFGRNNLYQNNQGRFTDIAANVGVEDMAGGMSVSWDDYNCDGLFDLYVGNMYSAAGNRVTYQRRFSNERDAEQARGIQRMARGNSLFTMQTDGTFLDDSEAANVTMGRWAWSSRFSDFNNDGFSDLVIANGYFTKEKTDDL